MYSFIKNFISVTVLVCNVEEYFSLCIKRVLVKMGMDMDLYGRFYGY